MINAAEALRMISTAPGASDKTTTDLRNTACDIEREADRKDRLTVARSASNRRKARAIATRREAEKLRGFARLCRVAADEVERRGCTTVGEAVKHPLVRAARRITRRAGLDHRPEVA